MQHHGTSHFSLRRDLHFDPNLRSVPLRLCFS